MPPSVPRWSPPSRTRLLARGATRRCPVCAERRIFIRYFHLQETCPRCGLRFARQEGHWSGDIGINTIVTFALLYVVLVGGTLLMWDDVKIGPLAAVATAVVLVFPVLFVPFAKTLWLAVDLAMRPVEPGELKASFMTGPTGSD